MGNAGRPRSCASGARASPGVSGVIGYPSPPENPPMLAVLLLFAADPLHARIDSLIPGTPSPPADDAEFLRRAYLDLAGTVPDGKTARAFLADKSADRRAK